MWSEAHPLIRLGAVIMAVATVVFMGLSLADILGGASGRPKQFDLIMLTVWADMAGFFVFVVGYCIDISN